MHTIQQLTPDLHEKWNEFVICSPQGGLFQTIDWNMMLCETEAQAVNYLPLVCVEDNEILGGILVRYRISSGKKIADLPVFGYSGPAFSTRLYNPERRHTYKIYSVFSELLQALTEQLDDIVLENQPEIWDARAYKFQAWRIHVSFTHIWSPSNSHDAWNGISPEFQGLIKTASQRLSFESTVERNDIQNFLELASSSISEFSCDVMRKRIEWMINRDYCRLYQASDKSGEIVGMALVILSRENQTAYLWDVVSSSAEYENMILPYIYFQSYSALADQFCRLDLGRSRNHLLNEIKDNLGCELTPVFRTRYQAQK
jgi:hypothetical protein